MLPTRIDRRRGGSTVPACLATDLRALLQADFDRRRRRDARYSLRAFALNLGVPHSTLLRFLRPDRRLTPRTARRLGARLGWTAAQIAAGCRHDQAQLVCRLVRQRDFRPDSRWLAVRSGLSLDEVNLTLQQPAAVRPPVHARLPAPGPPRRIEWARPSSPGRSCRPTPRPAPASTGQLFGWSVSQANGLGYRELKSGSPGGIDGGLWPAPPEQKGFVQLFIEVPDVDACLAQATKLGAQVIVPRSVLPDGDTMAVLLDPTGLSVGICTRSQAARPST